MLAGGLGSRLTPLTIATSKHLLPVYDQPLIRYSIATLMLAGITKIRLIVDAKYCNQFADLLGDGAQFGLEISYTIQSKPNGIAEAFLLSEDFIQTNERTALILGDNIFHGPGLGTALSENEAGSGAKIFAYRVNNPSHYGVVNFSASGSVISIEEKPAKPSSNFAVPGLYFYDYQVVEMAKNLRPSVRGELEITDINKAYLNIGQLSVQPLPRGTAWMDAGTVESLVEATEYVRAIEKRQGLKIGCLEEIAWRMGYIDNNQLAELAKPLMASGYGSYLNRVLEAGK